MGGVKRFYEQVLGCRSLKLAPEELVLEVSPLQTLTFRHRPDEREVQHAELEMLEEGLANNGAHVSMYLQPSGFSNAYTHAEALNCTFVNQRFKRRAYTKE